jgi:diguanylate cyclase (GGDEF)-like protein
VVSLYHLRENQLKVVTMDQISAPDIFEDIKERYQNEGIDPYSLPRFIYISEEEVKKKKKLYAEILEIGRLFMNRFLHDVNNTPMVFAITDDNGCFLDLGGDETIKDQMDFLGIKVGVEIKEELSSIHLALKYQRSMEVIGNQHHHHVLHSTACFSSPLYKDGGRTLIGTVGIMTSIDFATPFHLPMLSMVAESIEREVILRQQAQELKKANDHLRQMAMTDSLTGLFNRRYFDDLIYTGSEKTGSLSQPLSLILFDVDHFKLYNDTYGHEAGDQCLHTIGENLLNLYMGSPFSPCRYGGEEFALLLPTMGREESLWEAEKIKNMIMSIEIPCIQSGPVITISAGVATTMENNPKRLVSMADQALYLAKQNGRNQIYTW